MIEVAEKLVETVHGRKKLILVPKMVLAELAGRVTEWFQQLCNSWIFRPKPDIGSRHPDLGQAGANRVLAGDEGSAAGGAALLAVIVGEGRPFVANAVDVGRPVTHLATVVVADVPPADIITPENEDVRFCWLRH